MNDIQEKQLRLQLASLVLEPGHGSRRRRHLVVIIQGHKNRQEQKTAISLETSPNTKHQQYGTCRSFSGHENSPSVGQHERLPRFVGSRGRTRKFVLGESVFDFDGDIDMEHAEATVDTKTNNIESIRQNFVAFASAFSSKEDGSRRNFDEEIDSLFESTFHEMFVYDTPSQRFERAHVKEMYRAHVEVMGTRMSVIECHVDQEGRFEASLQIQNPCSHVQIHRNHQGRKASLALRRKA